MIFWLIVHFLGSALLATDSLTQSLQLISKIGKVGLPPTPHCQEDAAVLAPAVIEYIDDGLLMPGLCANSKLNRLRQESISACYMRAQKNFRQLLPAIKAAANIFSIPPDYLACLLYRESQFLETAQSGTGPVGLAQYSTATVMAKNNLLNTLDNSTDCWSKVADLEKQIAKTKNKKASNRSPLEERLQE